MYLGNENTEKTYFSSIDYCNVINHRFQRFNFVSQVCQFVDLTYALNMISSSWSLLKCTTAPCLNWIWHRALSGRINTWWIKQQWKVWPLLINSILLSSHYINQKSKQASNWPLNQLNLHCWALCCTCLHINFVLAVIIIIM